jgi:hypothetical protein
MIFLKVVRLIDPPTRSKEGDRACQDTTGFTLSIDKYNTELEIKE